MEFNYYRNMTVNINYPTNNVDRPSFDNVAACPERNIGVRPSYDISNITQRGVVRPNAPLNDFRPGFINYPAQSERVNCTNHSNNTILVSGGLTSYDIDVQSRNADLRREIQGLRSKLAKLQSENRQLRDANRIYGVKDKVNWNDILEVDVCSKINNYLHNATSFWNLTYNSSRVPLDPMVLGVSNAPDNFGFNLGRIVTRPTQVVLDRPLV